MCPADRPTTRSIGQAGEDLAAAFLAARGLVILARNVRYRFGEIDIVARDGDTLVFVEVRLRRSQRYGGAIESITAAKRARMHRAIGAYVSGRRSPPPCRVDAVLLDRLEDPRIEWLRDILQE